MMIDIEVTVLPKEKENDTKENLKKVLIGVKMLKEKAQNQKEGKSSKTSLALDYFM